MKLRIGRRSIEIETVCGMMQAREIRKPRVLSGISDEACAISHRAELVIIRAAYDDPNTWHVIDERSARVMLSTRAARVAFWPASAPWVVP